MTTITEPNIDRETALLAELTPGGNHNRLTFTAAERAILVAGGM